MAADGRYLKENEETASVKQLSGNTSSQMILIGLKIGRTGKSFTPWDMREKQSPERTESIITEER
ncbi:MAG: hypothetical protein K2N44_07635 [Lachnospiraceae bacterium]|nr:hypothetical protein [Lachnospiraceae bacterium]